jgi:GTP-binding protein
VRAELEAYDPALLERPYLVAASKCDLLGDAAAPLDALRARLGPGIPLLPVSGATRAGVDALVKAVAALLRNLPPVRVFEADYVPPEPAGGDAGDLTVRREGDVWLVEGVWLERLLGSVNLADYESRMYFDRALRQSGLFGRLERMGIQEGDTVSLYDCEFAYVK